MMSAVCLLILALPLVSAQMFHWGLCSKPTLQSNFSLSQFQGRWYEHRRLPSMYERGKCIEASIQPIAGDTQIVFSQTIDSRVQSSSPAVIRQDPEEPAKLVFGYFYNLLQLSWSVLYTDYHSTAVVYYCRDCFNLFHFDLAWLISRTRHTLRPEALAVAVEAFQRVNVSISQMLVADQSGCDNQ